MSNILDYISWRGDLSFKQSKFNEVDNLILSTFAYFPLDNLFFEDEKITIKEIYSRAISVGIEDKEYILQGDKELFSAMANSDRFGKLMISNYVNKIDEVEEKQFSAVTIFLPDDTIYVAFRGTDNTFVGWKEDLNMSFSTDVPAQRDAVKYLENIAQITKSKIRVGGHSKGGNLAIFASAFCSTSVKEQIIDIYNNDGPGMSETNIRKVEYKEILSRTHTFIPQDSVFGRLLYHEGKYTVVQSTQKGLLQHYPDTWQVQGTKFVYLDEVTNGSENVNKVIKKWLNEQTTQKREEFFNTLYKILISTNIQDVYELRTNWFKNARLILKAYNESDESNKKIVSETMHAILKITKENVFDDTSKPSDTKKKLKYNKGKK